MYRIVISDDSFSSWGAPTCYSIVGHVETVAEAKSVYRWFKKGRGYKLGYQGMQILEVDESLPEIMWKDLVWRWEIENYQKWEELHHDCVDEVPFV